MIVLLLTAGWAFVVGSGAYAIAARVGTRRRARAMAPRRVPRNSRPHLVSRVRARLPILGTIGRVAGVPLRRRRAQRSERALRSALPVTVDLVSVAVGAGCTPYQALAVTAAWSPVPAARELAAVERAVAVGSSFDDALQDTGARVPILRSLCETLRTSARLGTPAAAALGHLAQEVRADVRRRAEARARTVPVRLLFPLVFCILPAFALLTVVPVFADGLRF